jgi:hypothetical protein
MDAYFQVFFDKIGYCVVESRLGKQLIDSGLEAK